MSFQMNTIHAGAVQEVVKEAVTEVVQEIVLAVVLIHLDKIDCII